MKVALVGSAPSSIRLAPYADSEWTIWACSPGSYPILERCNAFFELHRWEPPVAGRADKQVPWFTPEYCQWLADLHKHDTPVYMAEVQKEIPSSIRYPREEMIQKYGPYFFTSSLAWMFALALSQRDITEIGLWGVDMNAAEEYGFQRNGCQHFIQLAKDRGIGIVVPPESDLLRPPPLYAISESSEMNIKLLARKRELESRLAMVSQAQERNAQEAIMLRGALENLDYIMKTWVD